jgi:predicted nucleic acid-binding protein
MRKAIPDWEVLEFSWQQLVGELKFHDQDYRHVLAAAIAGHADCIVTANLKHFLQSILI